MIEIELKPLGVVERGDPSQIWHKVVHTETMPASRLAYNLRYLWCPKLVDGADGPAYAVRFS